LRERVGQIAELQAAGCDRIYREKVSGAKSDRAELGKLLKALAAGDVVIVSRLDRLARSTLDLLTILRRVTEAGAKFRSLKDPWADTTTPHGELMVTILAGIATFERHLITARTDDGRKAAQARGVRFGRPPKLTPSRGKRPSSDSLMAKRRPMSLGPTMSTQPPSVGLPLLGLKSL
jgi:DNA invertase Pin-like site-specific DNA recombinase